MSLLRRWVIDGHPSWFPAFVHVLRLNPDKLDRVVRCGWRCACCGWAPPAFAASTPLTSCPERLSSSPNFLPNNNNARPPCKQEKDQLWARMGIDAPNVLQQACV